MQAPLFLIQNQNRLFLLLRSSLSIEIDHHKEVAQMWDSESQSFLIKYSKQHEKEANPLFRLFCLCSVLLIQRIVLFHHETIRKRFLFFQSFIFSNSWNQSESICFDSIAWGIFSQSVDAWLLNYEIISLFWQDSFIGGMLLFPWIQNNQ